MTAILPIPNEIIQYGIGTMVLDVFLKLNGIMTNKVVMILGLHDGEVAVTDQRPIDSTVIMFDNDYKVYDLHIGLKCNQYRQYIVETKAENQIKILMAQEKGGIRFEKTKTSIV